MVKIPENKDSTLEAMDRAIEAGAAKEPRRSYLGMSSIGDSCSRKLWYRLNGRNEAFDAATLRRFSDGHRTEELVLGWLRMVPGIEVHTHDENGEQYGFSLFDGRYSGHIDAAALGIIQAPKTWHIVEVKATNEKIFNNLRKLRNELGEKQALKAWSPVYYAQAMAYLHYAGLDRHYLICATPGGRDLIGVRTEANPVYAMALEAKAKRIIESKVPPERVGGPDFYQCRMCAFHGECHGPSD